MGAALVRFITVPKRLLKNARVAHLRGPLADDPNAKVLHALLVGLISRNAALAPKTLAALSEERREQPRNAGIALDVKRMADVIRKVADRVPAVASALAACADRFAYTTILNALEDPRTGPAGAENDRR